MLNHGSIGLHDLYAESFTVQISCALCAYLVDMVLLCMICFIETFQYGHQTHGVIISQVISVADVSQAACSVQERLILVQLWNAIGRTVAFLELFQGVVDQRKTAA